MIRSLSRKERFIMWIAWRLPRRLIYWCAVRLIAEASASDDFMDEVPDFKAMDALELWEYPKQGSEVSAF